MKILALDGLKNCFSKHAGMALLAASVSLNLTAQTTSKAGDTYAVASALYRRGDIAGASEELQKYLATAPSDAKARSLLALAFLKTNQRDKASQELVKLSSLPDSNAYVERLDGVVKKLEEQDRVRDELLKALREFDRAGSVKVVEGSTLANHQRIILLAWIKAYTADFAAATALLSRLPPALSEPISASINRSQKDFEEARCALQWLSRVAHGCPIPEFVTTLARLGRNEPMNSARADQVRKLLGAAPLSKDALNELMLIVLQTRPYDEFEAFADKVLGSVGQITIPIWWYRNAKTTSAETSYYELVIDAQTRTIASVPMTSTVFSSEISPGYKIIETPYAGWKVDWASIKYLRQVVHASGGYAVGYKSIAFEFAPNAQVKGLPVTPAFVDDLRIRQVVYNLGRFILHTIPKEQKIAASLVEVKASGGSALGAVLGVLATASGAAMGNAALTELGSGLAETDAKARAAATAAEARKVTWDVQAASNPFTVSQQLSFLEIETLLGLAQ